MYCKDNGSITYIEQLRTNYPKDASECSTHVRKTAIPRALGAFFATLYIAPPPASVRKAFVRWSSSIFRTVRVNTYLLTTSLTFNPARLFRGILGGCRW
jgi:hypothetical protein